MLKSIIDQLRAHRDRLDAAITELEGMTEPVIDVVPRHQHRKIQPIVLGSRTRALTSGASASRPVCARPDCGKVLGHNNASGYCDKHWYETVRKKPLGQKTVRPKGRPGPRTAKERHEMSERMKKLWAENPRVFGRRRK